MAIATATNPNDLPTSGSIDAQRLYQDSGQCIPFARQYSGIQVSGSARYVPVNSTTPAVGAVLITYESAAGHAAVVTAIEGNYIKVIERNFFHGWVSERLIPITSPFIKGYVKS